MPGPLARLNELRRAAEHDDAHEHAALHTADECLLEEGREPHPHHRPALIAYNFVKPHGTLTKAAEGAPTTPAMAAGVATAPWSIEQVVGLLSSN